MDARTFLDFLGRIETLKTNTRHCTTRGGTPETVAAHSWRLAVMAMLLRDQFAELDMDKVIRMCLIHDFGEAVTGDIPTFLKTEKNEQTENEALDGLLRTLPDDLYTELSVLYAEMEARVTPEARLYKTLDKLEAVIQHNESDIRTWIPLEFTLNQTYATEDVKEFPYLAQLREEMLKDTQTKIAEYQKETT